MSWLILLRRFWPAIPVLLIGLWGARVDQLRAGYKADLAACQAQRKVDQALGDTAIAEAERDYARQTAASAATYADRLVNRAPIILRSTDTVREYAKTDAGRVVCRGADRVRAIDQLDADLAAAAASAGGRAGAMPTHATASPAGR